MATLTVLEARKRRHRRVRARCTARPSGRGWSSFARTEGISAQLVDDDRRRHVASAGWMHLKKSFKGDKTEQAAEVGKVLAANAKKAGVEAVVFDRGGYLYHGRVKALADGAREGGLEFNGDPSLRISRPSGRCKAPPRGVLGRARSLRLRTLPASLRRGLFAAGGHDLHKE